jgi:hypothetical protein
MSYHHDSLVYSQFQNLLEGAWLKATQEAPVLTKYDERDLAGTSCSKSSLGATARLGTHFITCYGHFRTPLNVSTAMLLPSTWEQGKDNQSFQRQRSD